MFKGTVIAVAAATALTAGAAANATTISVETFSLAAFDAFHLNNTIIGYEDFEGFPVGEGNFTGTSVGDFTSIPEIGSGGTVIDTGTLLAVKEDGSTAFAGGRQNTTAGGSQWLDSNDNQGMTWSASAGGALFDQLAFSLSDAADVGATLTVSAGADTLTSFVGQTNNTVDWIVITFADSVASADITLLNNFGNDGFGIDDVSIAAIPLPAGAALLLTGMGGLAIARRRKATK